MNQIRTWVRQGRTDAWIAHQLEVPVQQVDAFKREHELLPDGADTAADAGVDVDLRAADDALIAAEMEAEEAARAEAEEAARVEAEAAARPPRRPAPPPGTTRRTKTTRRLGVVAGAVVAADEAAAAARPSSRARSSTARRATACGSIPPSPTAPCTPSTGPVIAASPCSSKRTRSSSAAPATTSLTPPTDSPQLSPTALPKPFQSTPTAVRTICSRGTCGCSLHHIASPVSPERTISAAISIVS